MWRACPSGPSCRDCRAPAGASSRRCAPTRRTADVTHLAFEAQLDAYLDGELAAPDAAELEQHLRACPECSRLERRRRALSAAVREQMPRFQAPDALRARVRAAVRVATNQTAHHRPSPWRV